MVQKILLCNRSQLKGGVTYVRTRSRACTCAVYLVGGGLIIEASIPVQELEGQRGDGAYFRMGLIFGRIRYYYLLQACKSPGVAVEHQMWVLW